jgi:glutamyl-tRNA synthetase
MTLREKLVASPEWIAPALHDLLNATAEGLGLKLGKLAQPLRVAVSGAGVSPPIDATLELLGRKTTLERLDRAIQHIQKLG